jgi:hypothetical protein
VERAEATSVLWWIIFGSIALWLAHVGSEVSLVRYSTTHHGIKWLMNGLTVGLLALSGSATFVAWRIAAAHRADESHVSPEGRTVFLGWLGVFVAAVNSVLILVEGIYLVALHG